MTDSQTREFAFESNICTELSERGWLYKDEGKTAAAGWDAGLALIPGDVLHWLASQYPEEYHKAIPADLAEGPRIFAERALLTHLTKELNKQSRTDTTTGATVGGLLGVLRTGFTYAQVGRPAATFGPMMVFPPVDPELTDIAKASDAVRLRVMRQVCFDTSNTKRTIDLVLCANGIPVVTIELKTDNAQCVNDAIRQYKDDRKPGPTCPLLAPGRALVHFAVSNDQVFMTTKLDGENTVFLPFNQGNNGHEGNPPSATGSATNYLWRDILARPTFMRILKDYALCEPSMRVKKDDGRLVFPRFHQLRAVERVISDIESRGPGGRYLVWHSAGSGKTKTIAWLSHRLIRHVDSHARSTFNSVIVVTDRTVLDENIRGDIGLVQSSRGLIVTVGEKSGAKSLQLKKALIEGDHIITCTLQTFPEVMKLIEDTSELRGRNWAVVADEAHSSQSGSSARGLKALLADIDVEDPENVSADELLVAKDSAIAVSSNITFIALTATPKAKTLRLFGTQDEDGNWRAFDTYTMAQAIEEGFILDVLTNYSTYDMFLRVKNELDNSEEEPLVDTGHAVTAIVQFARLHPTAIAQKVRVVVEHFQRNVKPLLTGTARAMVVTSSRLEAYRWFEAMNSYIDTQGYTDIRTLVAFSGSLESDDGETVTEASLNGRGDTARAFREEDYKVLIVANKFQTGFDEPRLVAMYVDKKLSGIAAVQTLSRLNRTCPGKTAPMVVDFQNTPASIEDDFKMYYSDAHVAGEVDPNSLITIAERLDTAGIYTMAEMEVVADAYLSEAGGEAIAKALGPIKDRWQVEWRRASSCKDNELKDSLRSFRADTISYRNAWQFLSQIVDYQDPNLHKRAILATLLSRNLHMDGKQYDDSYLEGVQLSGVQLVPSAINEDHSLSEGNDEAMELPGFDGEFRGGQTPTKGPLAEVIERVNEMFRVKHLDVTAGSVAGFISTYWGFLGEHDAVQSMAKNNSSSQLKASADFRNIVGVAMLRACRESQEIQSQMTDPSFLQRIVEITADALQTHYSQQE